MFENIRLITKKDNKISDPNLSWNVKSKIHCCCELELGMGDKMVWAAGNSIPLTRLIEFYDMVAHSITYPQNKEYQYCFVNNDAAIVVIWIRGSGSDFNFTLRYKCHNIDREILRKTIWGGTAYDYRRHLYLTVMRILTENVNEEVCVKVGDLFNKEVYRPYEFKIGQKVQTIPGPNVKTQRVGFILDRWYHMNDDTNMYQLMVDGKAIDKRYLPADLEPYNAAE